MAASREWFDPDAANIGAARRFVATVLTEAGRGSSVARATLVVSELATNAVLHAATGFEVDVDVAGGDIELGVSDAGPGVPVRRRVGTRARHGRGLAIVESVCSAWGVEARCPGKRVWCSLRDDVSAPPGEGG